MSFHKTNSWFTFSINKFLKKPNKGAFGWQYITFFKPRVTVNYLMSRRLFIDFIELEIIITPNKTHFIILNLKCPTVSYF